MDIFSNNLQGAIEMRQQRFQRGVRVRLLGLAEDGGPQETLPIGSEGTVQMVDAMGTIHVRWDCGSQLGVLLEDQVSEIAPST